MATSTIKSSGGDYTSLSAWEAAKQADITGLGPEIAECYDVDDTTVCGINGWTTTASDYIEIKAATAARCNGSTRAQTTNTYRLSANNSSGTLQIAENYVRIEGIEIKSTGANPVIGLFSQSAGANDTRYTDLVITTGDGGTPSGGSAAMLLSTTNANVTVTNCLVSANRAALDTRSCNSATVDHCTFYGENGYGVLLDADTTVTNTYSGGHTTEDWITLFSAPSGSHNASADTSASTDFTSAVTSAAAVDQFTSPSLTDTTFDFTLKSGNSLEGAGTGSLTNDIAGNPYGSPSDIGCFAPVAGGAFTLTAASGSFSLTGTAASLEAGYHLDGASGSFTLTGSNADLLYSGTDPVLTADSGSFTLTGTDAALKIAYHLDASSGSFSLSGTDVGLEVGYHLDAASGSFALTGSDADLLYDASKVLTADSGSFSLTGTAATLRTARHLDAESGSFALTGSNANLVVEALQTPDCFTYATTDIEQYQYVVCTIDASVTYLQCSMDDAVTYLQCPIVDTIYVNSRLC